MAPDSDLVFQIGNHFFGRSKVTDASISDGKITSHWSPFPGIEVTTIITPTPFGHSREHIINSSWECVAYDCGFSMPIDVPDYGFDTDENSAQVHSSLGRCMIYAYGSGGNSAAKRGMIISAAPNTNLLFPRCAIPAVRHDIATGTTEIITSVIVTPYTMD